MPLSLDEVRRIATLARIALTDAELERTAAQLGAVLALFEQLRAVDTAGVEPMTHPHDQTLRLRDDVADETDRREAGQAMAPAVERGLYLVPKVIE
jgi:aspartyl-tRNA(Asn)/glutamyl-tRNA(Gln) amidotransferase subunit C